MTLQEKEEYGHKMIFILIGKVNFKKGTYDFKFKFKDSIPNKGKLFTEISNRVYAKKNRKSSKQYFRNE